LGKNEVKMTNHKRIKLPGGKVLPYRPDPVEEFLPDNVNESQLIQPISVYSIHPQQRQSPSTSSNSSRKVLDMRVIDGSEVLIIGAGAVGSYVAYFLAAAAHVTVHLVDFDVVEHKHTQGGRTIYQAGQVHQKKVYAAKARIEHDHPNSCVHPYPYNVMDMPDGFLCVLARKVAIVANAIDDAAAMLKVNKLFYSLTEVLYVALHSAAASGHIILTVPYASACLRCSLDITSPSDIQTLHGEPGLGGDIRLVANYAATIALELMYSKVTGQQVDRWDMSKNIFYFANRREQLSPDGPGLVLQRAEKRPGCPICSAASNNLLLRS
jgi:molybdopterin/thiamine biosynthesis adenylyltransferase